MAEPTKQDQYFELLKAYVAHPVEEALFAVSELGRELMLANMSPEDMAEIHERALRRLAQENPDLTFLNASQLISAPLMELLMAYSLAFRERLAARDQAYKALRESEESLSQIVQGSAVATFVIDDEHTVTHWNRACENLTGIPADEMVGTQEHWRAFYAAERPLMADLVIGGVSEKEIASHYGARYRGAALIEGAHEAEGFFPDLGQAGRWLFFSAVPLRDTQGNTIGAIETLQDITERRRLEAQLRQASKMEAIGQLAGGVAHDFNNLLTVISGYSEFALSELEEGDPMRQDIEEVRQAGQRAAALTRQLLAFRLQGVTKMLGRLIGEDIQLETKLADDLGEIRSDPGQIEQVVMNLVVNARDAMPKMPATPCPRGAR